MDTIADFLIRIKNSGMAGRETVIAPFSKFNEELAKLLKKLGFLKEVEVVSEGKIKNLSVALAKDGHKLCIIEVKKISKPGRRVYLKAKALKRKRGLWITIVSTPKGLMEGKEAIKNNHGGEVICEIMKV